MPKRYKYKKPRSSSISTVPQAFATREMVKSLNTMQKVPGRLERGRELFLLAAAKILQDAVQAGAPDIMVGNKLENYAKDLRIAILDGTKDSEAVCLYFEHAAVELTANRFEDAALYFRHITGSPRWLDVLVRFGPWPAAMVPVKVGKGEAKTISRKARPDELNALALRLYNRRSEIEGLLRNAGAENPRIEQTQNAVGIDIHEDVAYNVLRKEFGFEGEMQDSHWRPAFRRFRSMLPLLNARFVRYLLTGRENVFDLPNNYGKMSSVELRKGEKFQKELAPFV